MAWLNGHGGDLLNRVEDDLSAISADAADIDIASAEADGEQVAEDAAAASADPPPFQGSEYVTAMSHMIAAGNYATDGDWDSANSEITTGGDMVKAMTDAINAAS